MQKIDLNVGSGGNANDDKNLQNSNIYYLKKPFGSNIINQHNQVIDVQIAISNIHNPNDNTTRYLHVFISDGNSESYHLHYYNISLHHYTISIKNMGKW